MPIVRWRVVALFFVHALALGAIHTRIPDIQLLIGLSEAQLGLVLIGQPLGWPCSCSRAASSSVSTRGWSSSS
jgi:hypothetical protein